MADKFLDKVYGETAPDKVTELYDAWSATYDSEISEAQYRTPDRVAAALREVGVSLDARILDYGCGTGLSGQALARQGFTDLHGTDPSAKMLAGAEAKQIYGRLWQTDLTGPMPIAPGGYDAIAAVGVISPGAGPETLLSDLLSVLPSGGLLAFSFNDHALEDAAYTGALDDLRRGGLVTVSHESYGDHLPGRGLQSAIYVLEKV